VRPGADLGYRYCFSNGEADVATGTVKWFIATKGYGFIQADKGAKVSYEETESRGKTSAENLRVG